MTHVLSPITLSINSPPSPAVTNSRAPSPLTSPFPSPDQPGSPTVPSFNHSVKDRETSKYGGLGLLIPTDREQHDLERKWLPLLGRLRVERELILQGYALYSLRAWVLSRTHWSHSIVTQTGKSTEHITAYLLVPEEGLSEKSAKLEVATAVELLVRETKAQARKTEFGTLLVTTPSAFGQDIFPVPGGDLRQARPFLVLNTGLRRLGCGGRAALALGEAPIPALRRKFHELYRLPVPTTASYSPLSRHDSPGASPTHGGHISSSPTKQMPNGGTSPQHHAAQMIAHDPFAMMVVGVVKLIQASLVIWGMYCVDQDEDLELDGMFCDETKAGILKWRRMMGMEHEESLKLEKETSGGCIDPKTLATLLSTITSARYHLSALGVERLPKDPFTNPRKFMRAWYTYQLDVARSQPERNNHDQRSQYITVQTLNDLNSHFLSERTQKPGDALKVHRFLLSGVASASATLKGGGAEDTPLRKREHHAHFRDHDPSSTTHNGISGVDLIIPDEAVGAVASPNAITMNLEAYIAGILKSREKDWDVMGARSIGELWSGHAQDLLRKKSGRLGAQLGGVLRRRTVSKEVGGPSEDTGDESAGRTMGALKGMRDKTGHVLKGGFGLVSRRGTAYETSDSEAGPGPSSIRNVLARKKQSTVPTVIEPDFEEVEEHLMERASLSPSPSLSRGHLNAGPSSTRASFLTAGSRQNSKRPSIITSLSTDGLSDTPSRRSARASTIDVVDHRRGSTYSHLSHQSNHLHQQDYHPQPQLQPQNQSLPRNRYSSQAQTPLSPYDPTSAASFQDERFARRSISERAIVWRDRGRAPIMLRTASDGADVAVEDGGNEWEVLNPHGTGRGQHPNHENQLVVLERRHSLQTRNTYKDLRITEPEHLAVDVDLCFTILELREKEKELAQKAKDLEMLEKSIFRATQDLIDAARARRAQTDNLTSQTDIVIHQLEKALEELDDDENLNWASRKIQFYLSEDTNTNEVRYNLEKLRHEWENVRRENERMRKEAEEVDTGKRRLFG